MSAQQPTEVVFNEHFLSRALKMAWLRQHHANDPKLRDELFEFDDLHKISSISAQLRNSYTTLGQSSEALCSLGETEEVKRQIKQKIEWLCPKSGLCLETKTTRNIKFVAYAGSVAVAGVSLWFTGGASILLAFLPQTNGFGTAICSLAASGAFGKLLDRYYSSVQADYDRLLAELLGGLGTRADRALAALLGETGMEKKLLEIAEAAKRNGTPVCDEGDFADLTPASADLVKERLDAIRLIRSMKELVFCPVVAVCGPANSGKTTLVSQMLMDPAVESGAGFDVGHRTTNVIVRPWGRTAFIIDTPGLDAAQHDLMRKFSDSAPLLGKAYVYIRLWQGPENRDDVETALRILRCSPVHAPHILIVLNKVIANRVDARNRKLSKKALTKICDSMKFEIQQQWLQEGGKLSEGMRWAQPIQSWFTRRLRNVKIVFGELGKTSEEISREAEDIADLVFDARKVAEWCVEKMDPDRQDDSLQEACRKVDLSDWWNLCDGADQTGQEAEESEESEVNE